MGKEEALDLAHTVFNRMLFQGVEKNNYQLPEEYKHLFKDIHELEDLVVKLEAMWKAEL